MFEGFTFTNTNSILSGTIAGNGSLILKAYYNRNSYTATFKNNGATYDTPKQVKYEGAISKPAADPTKNTDAQYTYTFAGWDPDPTGMTMPANNLTFNATYTANIKSYDVTFLSDVGGTTLKTESVEYGSAATAPIDPTKTGYTFDGWDVPFLNITQATIVTAKYTINSYTITFNSRGGTAVEEKTQNYNTTVNPPADPDKTGYTFKGWYKDNESFSVKYVFNTPMPAENITLYAKWEANTNTAYTIQYFKQGLGGSYYTLEGSDTQNETGTTGETAHILNYENKYAGFTYTVTADTKISGTIEGNGSLILKAYYNRNSYTVTFINNGATYDVPKQVEYQGTISKPAADPQKGEDAQYTYTFAGWDPDPASITMPANSLSITALYNRTIRKYNVTFYDDNGTTVLHNEDVEYGKGATAPIDPTKTGYTFDGWDVAFSNITQATTVTAKYVINSYTITFNSRGGTNVIAKTQDYNTTVTEPEAPTKLGYTFKGWYKDNESFSVKYVFNTPMPAESITLYAKWDANTNTKYTIQYYQQNVGTNEYTLVANHTEIKEGETDTIATLSNYENKYVGFTYTVTPNTLTSGIITADEQLTLKVYYKRNYYKATFINEGNEHSVLNLRYGAHISSPTTPTKASTAEYTYTFSKWNQNIPNAMPAENMIFQAIYTSVVRQYTYTFLNDTEDVVLKTATINYGGDIIAPEEPLRTGYTFNWDKAFSTISSNITIKATYTINSYTITFDSRGGDAVNPITENYNTLVTAPAVPTRLGYTFGGWYVDNETFENAFDFTNLNMPATDTALYAKWDAKTNTKYTIQYYQQNIDNDEYSLYFTSNKTGTTDTIATVTHYETRYPGFNCIVTAGSVHSGKITADEQLVLKVYYNRNYYIVTFINNGEEYDSQDKKYGANVTLPANPTKPATAQYTFTFDGWDKAIPATIPAENITITATYTVAINSYDVIFLSDEGGTTLKTERVAYGSGATAPLNPTKTGHTFNGWDKSFSNITQATTVTAKYVVNLYTITFNSNGGTNVDAKTANYGTNVIKPEAPTRIGYTFIDWYTDNETFENAFDFTNLKMPATDTTLYAKWNANTNTKYKVEYYKQNLEDDDYTLDVTENLEGTTNTSVSVVDFENKYVGFAYASTNSNTYGIIEANGSLTLKIYYTRNIYMATFINENQEYNSQNIKYGGEITVPANPAKARTQEFTYTFARWDKEVPITISQSITFAAVYTQTKNKYTVTFKDYNESVLKTQNVEYGSGAIAPADPNRVGYSFIGWDKTFENIVNNLVVKAKYSINQYTYTFYDADEKTVLKTKTVNYGSEIVEPAYPAKARTQEFTYTFSRWDKVVPETISEDISFRPIYTSVTNKYTVTFKNYDGSTIGEPQEVAYGSSATAPATPSRIGHTFSEWAPADFSNIMGPLTVVAQYSTNRYQITFNANGGTVVNAITLGYEYPVVLPENPIKEGYAFMGWYKDMSLTEKYVATTMPAENIVLYAKWAELVDIASFISDTNLNNMLSSINIPLGEEYETLELLEETYKDVKQGHTLKNWIYKDSSTSEESVITEETVFDYAGGFEILANYEANTYTLNFYSNYSGADAIAPTTVTYDTAIALPQAPTREGYEFAGWYNGDQRVEDGNTFLSADDVSLVARWDSIVTAVPETKQPDLLWLYFLLSIMGGVGITIGVYFTVGFVKEKRKAKQVSGKK
jgi:uncharacterized repeat protein (TIGR02543 family)